MSMPKRIAVGLVLWPGFMRCLGLFILEPEQRAGLLPSVLGVGTVTYLIRVWFRERPSAKEGAA